MDITYAFGTGDGEVTGWASPADFDTDGDGALDAVRLDFDGDGLIDDAMWDSDGDGAADTVRLDTTAEADSAERWFVDESGDGTWAGEIPVVGGAAPAAGTVRAPDAAPAAPEEAAGIAAQEDTAVTSDAADPAGTAAVAVDDAGRPGLLIDEDGDGAPDTRLADSDGDGYLDTARPSRPAEAGPEVSEPSQKPETPPASPAQADPGSAAGAILEAMAGLAGTGSLGTPVP